MNNRVLIAALGATTLASSAVALPTPPSWTSYTTSSDWYNATLAGISSTGGYYDPGSFANWTGATSAGSATTSGSAGYGWEGFSVSVSNGNVYQDTGSGNLIFTSTSTNTVMAVLFTFDRTSLTPPTATQGVYGFGLNFSTTGSDWTGIDANGVSVANGNYPSLFIGIVGTAQVTPNPNNPPLTTIQFNFAAGGTVTVAGSNYYMVPAPGAVALLGAAGLVSTRRRRN